MNTNTILVGLKNEIWNMISCFLLFFHDFIKIKKHK